MLLIAIAMGIGGYKLISKAHTDSTIVADAAAQPAPQASDQASNVPPTTYTVKSGDTLWSIARAYNTTVDQIMALNNLTSENLSLDQKLIVAGTAQAANPVSNVSTTTYTVKPGDTLWSIARANNTTVNEIKALNNLSNDNLSLEQKLVVAGTAPVVSPGTSSSSNTAASSKTSTASKSTKTQVASRSGNTSMGGSVLSKAAQYLHTPYVWGGTSPRGFDCSGFVQYVYRQCGYSLPRVASDQAAAGRKVNRSDLKPGDLVYFSGGGEINHIGIYVGNGKFIHSSSPSSGGVIYSSLSESYYAARYAGATRILR
ncbi:MAG: LysM peptidoglycan-binding domain-containing protein [Syntrophomonas sp.]